MSVLDPAADAANPPGDPAPVDPKIDPPANAEPPVDPAATSDPKTATPAPADPAGDPPPLDPEKDKDKTDWPDDWRDRMASGDEDIANVIKRYGSPKGVAKALKEAQALIRSGKVRRDMPDPTDEKAMAEWRKEQGIPDDPTGYVLPETVTKRMTDEDKPLLASFTDYAHKKGAPQQVVDIASEWYFDTLEGLEGERLAKDTEASESCEEELRKDWAHGEYKANLTLGKRFMESVPGVGSAWTEARLPDGRRLGDIPEFVMWAADMGRDRFGDATFANSDSERQHTARKTEIEKVMNTDIDRYYSEGLDKEYSEILEREAKRRK